MYKRLTDDELQRLLKEIEEKGGVAGSKEFADSPDGEARYKLELQATMQDAGATDEEIEKALEAFDGQ